MNPASSNSSFVYFPALTGVRALAALLVYIHHFNPIHQDYFALNRFFYEFYVGVTFFFVLSGLLITLRYSDRKIDFKDYFVNRAARIYPMWFILTIITFLVSFKPDFEWLWVLLSNLTFLKGFSDKLKFTGIDQGWSLTVEECFYFLAPIFIFILSKRRWMVFVLPLILLGVGAVLHLFFKAFNIAALENFNFIFLYTIFGRSWEFLLGVLFALIYKAHKNKLENIYRKFFGINSILVLCIVTTVYLMSYFEDPWSFGNTSATGKILCNFLLPILIVLFYIGLIVKKDFYSKILSTKAFIFGGKISYVFYLIHVGIFHKYLSQLLDWAEIMKFRKTIEFIVIVLLSAGLYFWLEEPLNKKVKKLFGKNKKIVSA